MKTDKELLQLAARAAGLKYKWFKVKQYRKVKFGAFAGRRLAGHLDVFGTHHTKPWNPLLNDGDALRLAVDLGITPNIYSTCVAAKRYVGDKIDCEEDFGNDKHAATRRAIVRAAAAIGEGME